VKGKHAASATTRRVIREAETSLETYQRRVAKLTAENKELRDRLAAKDKAHSQAIKRLKAERDEGLSPMIAVLQQENVKLKERGDHSKRDLVAIQSTWDRTLRRMWDHFVAQHSMTRLEAIEELVQFTTPSGEPITLVGNDMLRTMRLEVEESSDVRADGGKAALLGSDTQDAIDRVRTLQRVRGER